MENPRAFFGALFLIGVIVSVNILMYGIVRGVTRSGKKNFLETLGNSFNPPNQNKKDPMNELRQKVAELNGEKKSSPPDSE